MPEPAPLFPVVREHLESLTDEFGIRQHARGVEPDPAHGTCTDDVARALVVDLDHADVLGSTPVKESLRRSLRYLVEAFDPATGRFRNFRAADGTWLDRVGSEDCHGRAMLALAEGESQNTEGRFTNVEVRTWGSCRSFMIRSSTFGVLRFAWCYGFPGSGSVPVGMGG